MNNLRVYFNAIGNVRFDGHQISLDIVDIVQNQNETAQNNKLVTLVTDIEAMKNIVQYLNTELSNINEFVSRQKSTLSKDRIVDPGEKQSKESKTIKIS